MTEETTLRSLLTQYHAQAWQWARQCCRYQDMMAEEVLQTTYVKVLEGGTQPRDWAAFKPWLFGVIRLTALEWWRKAAGAGDVKAMASLGHALWDGPASILSGADSATAAPPS